MGDFVFEIPAVSSPDELVNPSEKELIKFARGLRMKRMFVPNCNVCLPRVHDKSSTMLYTGVWKERLRLTARLELFDVLLSLSPRKKMNGCASLFPISPELCRVKPQWKLLIKEDLSTAV